MRTDYRGKTYCRALLVGTSLVLAGWLMQPGASVMAQTASSDGPLGIRGDERAEAADQTVLALGAQVKPMSEISLDVLHPDQPLPPELVLQGPNVEGDDERGFTAQTFQWSASRLSHEPLYFEDIPLERYGQTRCLQPAWSAAHFFGSVALLPYKVGLNAPHDCIYTLGHVRPGDCSRPVRERLPFSWRGAALEAAAAAGVVSLFP
jgi:hypothetical protein